MKNWLFVAALHCTGWWRTARLSAGLRRAARGARRPRVEWRQSPGGSLRRYVATAGGTGFDIEFSAGLSDGLPALFSRFLGYFNWLTEANSAWSRRALKWKILTTAGSDLCVFIMILRRFLHLPPSPSPRPRLHPCPRPLPACLRSTVLGYPAAAAW